MRVGLFAAGVVLTWVCSSSSGLSGEYRAELEVLRPASPGSTDEQAIHRVRERLTQEPESLVFESGGKLRRTVAGATLWEGTWCREGSTLFLNVTQYKGENVQKSLQSEKSLTVREDGALAEAAAAEGYALVFKRKP